MGVLHTKKQTQSAEYNFLIAGGGIGSINLGMHIPKFALITRFVTNAIVAPNSLGAATISFGFVTTDTSPGIASTAGFMPLTAFAGFVLNTPVIGIDFNANPIKLANYVDLTMSIAVAALTDGRIQVWVEYDENIV